MLGQASPGGIIGIFMYLLSLLLVQPYMNRSLLACDTVVHAALTFIFAWAPFLATKGGGSEKDFNRLRAAASFAVIFPIVVMVALCAFIGFLARADKAELDVRTSGRSRSEQLDPDAASIPVPQLQSESKSLDSLPKQLEALCSSHGAGVTPAAQQRQYAPTNDLDELTSSLAPPISPFPKRISKASL